MMRPPTTWVLLANEIQRCQAGVLDLPAQNAAVTLAGLIIEASERPADKLKQQRRVTDV